jgi:hypothetical protein
MRNEYKKMIHQISVVLLVVVVDGAPLLFRLGCCSYPPLYLYAHKKGTT